MIRIRVTPDDLVDMRFAYSPLMELSTSFHLLQKPKLHTPYLRWIDEAQAALHDVELPLLNDLHHARSYIPDFLTPTPCSTRHTIEDDLNLVIDLPPEMIRTDIQTLIESDGETAIRRQFLAYPYEAKMQLIDELRVYWQRTLNHHWSRMSSVLDGDVLYRARKLALDGVEALFADLHPSLTYTGQQITIDKPNCRYACDLDLSLDGKGLQLVTTVLADHARLAAYVDLQCAWGRVVAAGETGRRPVAGDYAGCGTSQDSQSASDSVQHRRTGAQIGTDRRRDFPTSQPVESGRAGRTASQRQTGLLPPDPARRTTSGAL